MEFKVTKFVHIITTIIFGLGMVIWSGNYFKNFSGLLSFSPYILFVIGLLTITFYFAKEEEAKFRLLSMINVLGGTLLLLSFELIPSQNAIIGAINVLYGLYAFWSREN